MTDTDTALLEPTVPAATPDEPAATTQRGRPTKVVERDLRVARLLAERERSKQEVMDALGLDWRVVYNSFCRLRDRGVVELNRNGTRTPTWRVTDAGHEWLGTTAPEGETPAPPPPPEPAPVAEVPTPPTPEPAPVAEVPAPAPVEEPGSQPVPITPPAPSAVAPSPGPEPTWPI